MIWFWICGITFVILWIGGIIIEINDPWGEAAFVAVFGGAMGGLFAVMIGCLLNLLGSVWTGTHYEPVGQTELLSLQDNIGTRGSFFLGSGSVDDEAAFFFYEKLDYGARLSHLDADDVLIIEEDIDQPYYETLEETSDNNFWLAEWLTDHERYEFHIPEGSIAVNYSLDAN